ncbi:exonuclease SbcC [Nocardiaceae bacterium YC2-7]|uniref:Exonuclease SbcC n=1 Tax=Antrihabitans stalactiti TaxID=2584121 RepID=A0A848KEG6_9NOCA|nr:exonuclease SbcC [Antrihabitans stalactiti]
MSARGPPALTVALTTDELREVTRYAVACAEAALPIFERDCADDARARAVLDEARKFVDGGNRTKALRMAAFDAHRAAREAVSEPAAHAARAAGHAGGAAYLHPLAKATQVLHILGSAAHAARAIELDGGSDFVETAQGLAGPIVVAVLTRYPNAPGGGGRVGELIRSLDASLRT